MSEVASAAIGGRAAVATFREGTATPADGAAAGATGKPIGKPIGKPSGNAISFAVRPADRGLTVGFMDLYDRREEVDIRFNR